MIWMKSQRGRRVLAVLIVVLAAVCTWAWAQSAATVRRSATPILEGDTRSTTPILKVDTTQPGNAFDLGAAGLSTEARALGTDYLSASHYRLVRLMRLLGPSVLRIGGDSADSAWWTSSGEPPPPWATNVVTPADLYVLRGLLAATGWRVLLDVDLGHFEPARAADEARYAQMILGSDLLGVEIGNEPNAYGGTKDDLRPSSYGVNEYLREARAYSRALSKATGVAVYGPALSIEPPWLPLMGSAARMFTVITQHFYPIDRCPTIAPAAPQATAVALLSPAVRQREEEVLQMIARAGSLAGRLTRIGETNGVACGVKEDASPGFAAALWALDWILRAESSGIRGLNFHGELRACSSDPDSPICARGGTAAADAGNITSQPVYYGLLAARQLEGGRFVPTRLVASGPLPNLTSWATIAPSGTIRIAIDNMATTGLAQPVSISISGYAATEEMLTAPSLEASSGITLGGAPVTGAGQWRPKPTRVKSRRPLRVIVRPASAIIITLRRR
jgi:hypothetical protein